MSTRSGALRSISPGGFADSAAWSAATRARAATLALLGDDVRWLFWLTGAVLVLCAAPYLLADHFGPPDLSRLGTFWFVRDFTQYQAAMREGAHQTGWLTHDHFTAEPHQAVLMYPLYVATGKLAAALRVDPLGVFGALEWLGRLSVVAALYAFVRTFLENPGRVQMLAMVLALGTLGLDALAAPLRMAVAVTGIQLTWLPETINPYLELSSFGALLSAPHLMFALALTLLAAPLYLRASAVAPDGLASADLAPPAPNERIRRAASPGCADLPAPAANQRAATAAPHVAPPAPPVATGAKPAVRHRALWLALLGLDVLALSLVQVFTLPVLATVVVLHAVLSGRRAWPTALIVLAAAAPMTVYSVMVYGRDPFWSATYGAQNLMPSPPVYQLPFDFGVVLLAAPLAWPVLRRWRADRRLLIVLWIMAGLAWMYAPLPYQRRFAFGVEPALAVLAAVGLLYVNSTAPWPRWANLLVALAGASTSLLVYISLLSSAASNWPAEVYVWSRPEAAAAAWLGDHSTADDVVLASTDFSNALAGSIDGRVVHGHVVATFDSDAKAALVRRFFGPETSTAERAAMLRDARATVVAVGPRERALGASDLAGQPDLEQVYDRDGVQLYRVRRAA